MTTMSMMSAEMDKKKRYNCLENLFQSINSQFISLDDKDKKQTSDILLRVVKTLTEKMKEISPLFKNLFQEIFYGGSYYDGLKVGKPDEYDLDMKLVLPKILELKIDAFDKAPGFVSIQSKTTLITKEMSAIFENDHLCTNKCKKWFESVVAKALTRFERNGSQHIIKIDDTDFFMKIKKGGPAFTLNLHSKDSQLKFDVDLVPCFTFDGTHWPQTGNFRANPVKEKGSFFVVPKSPKTSETNESDMNLAWRLSFQEQERKLMQNCRYLKPCIKLMKKLRDKLGHHGVSSYFIKTVFLWELEKRETAFWGEHSLSYVLMEMLNVYADYLNKGNLPYYWNKSNNLLESIPKITLEQYANRMKRVIAIIEKSIPDSLADVIKLFLTNEEAEKIKLNCAVVLSTKPSSEVIQISNNNGDVKSETTVKANIGNININASQIPEEFSDLMKSLKEEIAEIKVAQERHKREMVDLLQVIVAKLNEIDCKRITKDS